MDDHALLREYVDHQSERAFAELAKRYVPFVHTTALRLARDPHTAEEMTQAVFIQLARKAWKVRENHTLSGWLYRATQRMFLMNWRADARRRKRESESFALAEQNHGPENAEAQIAPVLDEALRRLSKAEQEAVLLRIFQNKSFPEVGLALGLNEDAARKRVDRALEKMRSHFARVGVTTTGALLASALAANAATLPPAGLVVKVTGVSLAGAARAGGVFHAFWRGMQALIPNRPSAVAAVMLAVFAVPMALIYQENVNLRRQLALANARESALANASLSKNPGAMKIFGRLAAIRREIEYACSLTEPQLMALLERMSADSLSHQDAWIPVDRLVQLDPTGAFAWAENLPNGAARNEILKLLFASWAFLDPAKAFQMTAEIDNVALRLSLRQTVLADMANVNPQGVLELLSSLPSSQQSESLYGDFFRNWAARDPAAAAAAVQKLPPTMVRNYSIPFVIMGWAQSDPRAALAWADTLRTNTAGYANGVSQNALATAVGLLAQQDPQAAASYVGQLTSATMRNDLIQIVAANWGQKDPLAALAWVDEYATGQTHDVAMEVLVGQYAQNDPAGAVAYLAKIPDDALRGKATVEIGNEWAEQNVQAALAWVRSLPDANDPAGARLDVLTNVMGKWAGVDPAAAADYARGMKDDAAFGKVIQTVAAHWQSADPEAAFAWAESLPADAGGRDAMRSVITQYSIRDPIAAWSYAQQITGDLNLRDAASIQVLGKWAEQNPTQAASALADANIRSGRIPVATESVAKIWVQQDPVAAAQWINTLAPGAARDGAACQLIALEGKNDLSSAFHWAASLAAAVTRQNQLPKVVTQWAQKDPAAATAAVQSVNLAGGERTALLNIIGSAASVRRQ